MQITRNGVGTMAGPGDWFTDAVSVGALATPAGLSRLSASNVHFAPGVRTACRTHPKGQTVFVIESVGYAQRRGGPIGLIRPGDRVFFEPGEDHWHRAMADHLMTPRHVRCGRARQQLTMGRARQRRGVRSGAFSRMNDQHAIHCRRARISYLRRR